MICSLSTPRLLSYVQAQLNNFFPDEDELFLDEEIINNTLKRIDYCFSHVTLKHYFNGTDTQFNHLYSDHYVMFVWYLSNEVYKKHGKNNTSNKLYYLNKSLNGLDCMFDTKMPEIFLIFHGVGTMLGKATYSDFFVALHGCTIGSHKGSYPVMGKGVSLTAHSSIIGNCKVGDRVSVSSYTSWFEKDIPADSLIVKDKENGLVKIRPSESSYAQIFFNVNLKDL